MKNTAKQAPADAAAVATAHRPENETKPATAEAPGIVTIDEETARTAAGWLRAYLADAVTAEDYPLDAEGIASVTRCIAALEGVTAIEA